MKKMIYLIILLTISITCLFPIDVEIIDRIGNKIAERSWENHFSFFSDSEVIVSTGGHGKIYLYNFETNEIEEEFNLFNILNISKKESMYISFFSVFKQNDDLSYNIVFSSCGFFFIFRDFKLKEITREEYYQYIAIAREQSKWISYKVNYFDINPYYEGLSRRWEHPLNYGYKIVLVEDPIFYKDHKDIMNMGEAYGFIRIYDHEGNIALKLEDSIQNLCVQEGFKYFDISPNREYLVLWGKAGPYYSDDIFLIKINYSEEDKLQWEEYQGSLEQNNKGKGTEIHSSNNKEVMRSVSSDVDQDINKRSFFYKIKMFWRRFFN